MEETKLSEALNKYQDILKEFRKDKKNYAKIRRIYREIFNKFSDGIKSRLDGLIKEGFQFIHQYLDTENCYLSGVEVDRSDGSSGYYEIAGVECKYVFNSIGKDIFNSLSNGYIFSLLNTRHLIHGTLFNYPQNYYIDLGNVELKTFNPHNTDETASFVQKVFRDFELLNYKLFDKIIVTFKMNAYPCFLVLNLSNTKKTSGYIPKLVTKFCVFGSIYNDFRKSKDGIDSLIHLISLCLKDIPYFIDGIGKDQKVVMKSGEIHDYFSKNLTIIHYDAFQNLNYIQILMAYCQALFIEAINFEYNPISLTLPYFKQVNQNNLSYFAYDIDPEKRALCLKEFDYTKVQLIVGAIFDFLPVSARQIIITGNDLSLTSGDVNELHEITERLKILEEKIHPPPTLLQINREVEQFAPSLEFIEKMFLSSKLDKDDPLSNLFDETQKFNIESFITSEIDDGISSEPEED